MGAQHSAVPELVDESPDLWDEGFGDAARRLLTAGVRCFATNGFHATKTRDITSAAGLSSAALYVHFASKEHVLFEIVRAAHKSVLAVVSEPPATGDPAAHLKSLVARFVAWHARYHVAGRVGQYELSGLTPDHYATIIALRQQTTAVFHEAIRRGTRERAFGPVDDHRVVRAILSLCVDLVRWYRLDGPDSPEEVGHFYAELALGMVTAAGTVTPSGDGV
ncbi:TetR/AcrR family transcriptional regulator [Amycolatopsis sp. NPDC051903]|uniref:TetR/AcrR family transcriptional regulator n=1 Tax=Amycolatopsis sp. NPDC051903 TaxID=3363936 RepID=UPI003790ED88